jgi:hypothetical protein
MNTGGRSACALVAVAVAVGLSGCSTAESPQTTVPVTTAARKPMFQDTGLRDVRKTSGRALGYVQPETASQILCQLLDKDEWERLLDGPVGRRPFTGPNGGCHVATAEGGVIIELRSSDDALEPDTTIAGRPARKDISRGSDGITVALTDDALRPAPRQYYPERRLLSATPIVDDPGTELDLAERVLEEIVPLVIKDGEELPDTDDRGYVRYVDTPLTGDFVDLPTPVQALQLCTIMRKEPGVRDVEVRETGDCRVQTGDDSFTVAARPGGTEYTERIAGRPALTSDDLTWVEVKLRDDAATSLWVTSDNAVELTEKLVPLLTA